MLCSLGSGSAMDDLSEARSVTGTGSTGRSAKELDMLFSAAGGPAIDDSSKTESASGSGTGSS